MRAFVMVMVILHGVMIFLRVLRLMRSDYPIKGTTSQRMDLIGLVITAGIFVWGMKTLQ